MYRTLIALLISLSLLATGCGEGGTGATPPTTPATSATTPTTAPPATSEPANTTTTGGAATTALDVVLVTPDDELNVRADAGIDFEIVATLQPTASDIIATGRTAAVDGETWWEVNVGGDTGWAHGQFLTIAVPHDRFSEDREVLTAIGAFTSALDAGAGFDELISPKDLWIAHFDRPRNFPREDLSGIIASDANLTWSGPACHDCIEATFSEMVVADFVAVANDPNVEIAFDTHVTGVKSSAGIPVEFENFRFVSLHRPGAEDSLDWTTWNVYFDYVKGSPTIVGLSVDQYSP